MKRSASSSGSGDHTQAPHLTHTTLPSGCWGWLDGWAHVVYCIMKKNTSTTKIVELVGPNWLASQCTQRVETLFA